MKWTKIWAGYVWAPTFQTLKFHDFKAIPLFLFHLPPSDSHLYTKMYRCIERELTLTAEVIGEDKKTEIEIFLRVITSQI